MRVGPIGWACRTYEDAVAEARRSAVVTHDHPDAVQGAMACAAAVFLARVGASKDEMRRRLCQFGYDLDLRLDEVAGRYACDETAAESVAPALIAFFASEDFEGAIRNAVSLGGDADTIACIAGSVAEAHYRDVPATIRAAAEALLDAPWKTLVQEFEARYGNG